MGIDAWGWDAPLDRQAQAALATGEPGNFLGGASGGFAVCADRAPGKLGGAAGEWVQGGVLSAENQRGQRGAGACRGVGAIKPTGGSQPLALHSALRAAADRRLERKPFLSPCWFSGRRSRRAQEDSRRRPPDRSNKSDARPRVKPGRGKSGGATLKKLLAQGDEGFDFVALPSYPSPRKV